MSTPFLWHNGRIKPWAEATVHVSTHALHYGSSVFEGERVYATPQGPAYFRLADHTRRLFESARIYEIEIGYSEQEINAACLELIRANRMASAYVRPIVFRGAGGLGVLPKDGAPVDVRSWRWTGVRIWAMRRSRRGRVRVVVASPCTEHASELGQGRRQLPQQPVDRSGSAPRRLRRRHRAGPQRPAQRRRRRKPVPGQARQAAHATVERRHPGRHHPRHRDHAGRRPRHRGRRTRPAARGAVFRRRSVHDRHRRRDHAGALGRPQERRQRRRRPDHPRNCSRRSSACSTAAPKTATAG
jgi:hypothetical protein